LVTPVSQSRSKGGIGWLWSEDKLQTEYLGMEAVSEKPRMKEHPNVLNLSSSEYNMFFTKETGVTKIKLPLREVIYNPVKFKPTTKKAGPKKRKGVSQLFIDAKIDGIIKKKTFGYWVESGYLTSLQKKISASVLKRILTNRVKVATPPGAFVRSEEVSEIVKGYENTIATYIYAGTIKSEGIYRDYVASAEKEIRLVLRVRSRENATSPTRYECN
jgi:hypothetical protein